MAIRWITFGTHALAIGANASLVNSFFQNFIALESDGGTPNALLKKLSDGNVPGLAALPEPVQTGIQGLASFLLDQGIAGKLKVMRTPLGDVLDDNTAPVVLDFPLHRLSVGPLNVSNLPIGLSLSTESAIAYTVGTKDQREASPTTALTVLSLDGKIAFNANLAVPIGTVAGLNSAASVSARRKLSYALRYDRKLQTWQSVADAMSRLVPIDDFQGVLTSFRAAPPSPLGGPTNNGAAQATPALDEIKMTGEDSLLVKAGTTLRIPLADAGTLKGRASGQIELGGGFSVRITQAGSRVTPGRPVLVVTAERTNSIRRSTELGIGYTFGLSHLSPAAAKSLLSAMVDVADALDKIDSVLGDAETFLKPGTLLKTTMSDLLEEAISGESAIPTELRIVFGDLLGFDADGRVGTIAEHAAEVLATLIDDSDDLFEGEIEDVIALVFAPFTTKLKEAAKDKIADIVAAFSTELQKQIDAAATEIDHAAEAKLTELLGVSPTDEVAAIRSFLKKARTLLADVTKRVADRSLDLVTAELAWSHSATDRNDFRLAAEISEEAHEFYRGAIWRPSVGANRLLTTADDPIPGVHPLTAQRTELARRLGKSTWNIGIIDALVSTTSANTSFAEVKVKTTMSGVSVGSSAWNENRSDLDLPLLDSIGRSARLSDALTFVTAEGPDGGPIETCQLGLSYVWNEQGGFGLSSGEIRKFCNTFKKAELLSESGADALAGLLREAGEDSDGDPRVELKAQLVIPPDYAVKVIRYAASTNWWAKEVIKDIVGDQRFFHELFENNDFAALVDYFKTLDQIRGKMMALPVGSDAAERTQLRAEVIQMNADAQTKLVMSKWLAITHTAGVLWDPPQPGILAFFRCLAELTAQMPGCGRPGMVYSFAVKNEAPRYVICPRAGDAQHWDESSPLARAPTNVMMRRYGLLRQGSRGRGVAVLQRHLLQHSIHVEPVEPLFRANTDVAVREFQATKGLTVDGYVGAKTWAALAPTA